MAKVIELNNENFQSVVLEATKPVYVDFKAVWCAPCRYFAPVFEEYANENDDVICASIDIDECPQIAMKYSVSAVPTTMLFIEGTVCGAMMGAQTKETLAMQLEWVLSHPKESRPKPPGRK